MKYLIFKPTLSINKSFFENHIPKTSPCPLQRGTCINGKSPFEGGRGMFLVGEIRIDYFKKYLRVFAILFLLINITYHSKAQAISYYPFNSQLSIATNPTKVVWMDFRVQMNSFTSSLNTEPALMVNLAYTQNANFYAGAGANLGIIGALIADRKLINGYFGSFGVRAYPFKEVQKVSVNFELSPYVEQDGKAGFFRAWLGVGYHFGGKNN
jgi:hypothetical protein